MSAIPRAASLAEPSLDDREALQRAFGEQGFLVLRGLLPADRLGRLHADIVAAFERANAGGALFAGGGLMTGHLNCSPGEAARWVYDALVERGVIDLVKSVSPNVVRLPNVGCNFNLPGSVIQHWHADGDFTKAFMIVNVPTVDTTLENGATEVAPGTHREWLPFWRFAMLPPSRHSVRVPLRAGDVLVRTSVTWHRGMPNRTASPRPMLAFTWEDGGSKHADPFLAESGGRVTFRPNWFRPTALGRLRERTYKLAPFSYDAYRFARSLVGRKGY